MRPEAGLLRPSRGLYSLSCVDFSLLVENRAGLGVISFCGCSLLTCAPPRRLFSLCLILLGQQPLSHTLGHSVVI